MARQEYFSIGAVQPRIYHCATRAEIGPRNLQRHLDLLGFFVRNWSSTMGAPCRLVHRRKVYETEMWPANSLMGEARSRSMAEWEALRRAVIERRRDVFARSRSGPGAAG